MKIYAFGELIWDLYPGKKSLGGTALNFALHLKNLGADVALLSAVGSDALGAEALSFLQSAGLSTDTLTRYDGESGTCRVELQEGQPTYRLTHDQAYEHIRVSPPLLESVMACGQKSLYFGTLAQCGAVTRQSLRDLLQRTTWQEIFYDVNIRPGLYSREIVEESLRACTVLKCSREEAGIFGELGLSQHTPGREDRNPAGFCRELSERYEIRSVVVTLDRDGAFSYEAAEDRCCYAPAIQGRVVSAVGAGDSFFAAYADARLRGGSPEQCLANGVRLSSYVVGCLASVPALPAALREELRAMSGKELRP